MLRALFSSTEFSAIKLIFVYEFLFLINHCAAQVPILMPPQNTTVIRGSNVTVSCGYWWVTALPTVWIINGTVFSQEDLQDSPLYQLNNPTSPMTYSLTVFSINGTTTFQCVVLSDPTTTSTLGTVTVIGVNFNSPPQNTTVIRGSNVTISCGYQWHTALLTEWIINGTVFSQQDLRDSPLYQLNNPTSPMTYSLTVFSINGTTTFQCVVLSDPTILSKLGTITVIDAPPKTNITMPPENITVCRGSDVIISCGHVIDVPRPVMWIINGTSFTPEQILFNPLYQLNRQTTPSEVSLIVFSINRTTTFQCVVLSTTITTSTLGTVTVLGPTINIKSAEINIKQNRFEITVSWQVGTDCSETVVMYNITVMDQYSSASVTVPATMLSVDISELPDNGTSIVANREYTITVSALSDHGYSYPSHPVVVNTFVLQNCAVTSPSIGTIRVSCDSSHQILVTLTCTDNCSNPTVNSNGSSPLILTGLDPGVTYSVIINVFDGSQVVFICETVAKLITAMVDNSGSGTLSDSKSDDSSLSTGAVVAVTCIVTLIISVTVTAVITFIITYTFVKRKIECKNDPKHQSTDEKVLYEQVSSPTSTITKKDLELQPNPAYGVSHKVNIDSNPAYESCK